MCPWAILQPNLHKFPWGRGGVILLQIRVKKAVHCFSFLTAPTDLLSRIFLLGPWNFKDLFLYNFLCYTTLDWLRADMLINRISKRWSIRHARLWSILYVLNQVNLQIFLVNPMNSIKKQTDSVANIDIKNNAKIVTSMLHIA